MLDPVPRPASGLAVRCTRALSSPWSRLSLLVAMLAAAAVTVVLYEPQRLLSAGWPPQLSGAAAVVMFGVAYGACTAAFVPRPLLNLAAGALFGSQAGLVRRSPARCWARASPSCSAGCWGRTRCGRCCAAAG